MKWHMDAKHPEIDLDPEIPKAKPPTKRSASAPIWKFRSKKDRAEMFENSIPGWVKSKTMLPFESLKAQKFHRSIFEAMVLDLVPFSEVDKPGFLRHHQIVCPNFDVASAKYYR